MNSEPLRPLTKRLRTRHWVALDVFAALVGMWVAALRVLDASHDYDPHRRGYPDPTSTQLTVALLAIGALGVALMLRRTRPALAIGVLVATWAVVVCVAGETAIALALGGPFVVLVSMAAVYSAAVTYSPRGGLAVLAVGIFGGGQWWLAGSADVRRNAWLALLFTGTAWAVGYAVGRHRAYAAALREHHAELVRSEFAEERLRLAREVHDVIAHSLGVVNVQAGYGGFVLDQRPEQAREALAAIHRISGETIREMRGLLGVLRADGPADRLPAPGLADLPALLERTAEAGLHVDLSVSGGVRELPAGIELSAYRIVQEALTNIGRHAHTGSGRVRVDYRADALAIEITDEGVGLGPAFAGAESAESYDPPYGHGLAGMRERVGLYDGEFSAGPLPGRGFRVAAVLPLSERVG
ncbi:sensor histidine kinase [Embleya scabrispora]|uniref:sensor histidine kinase n=1 Tax=Embleya scabrispora TaxID=159449 RepID=UPI00035E2B05|nr:histidine kinase [Embleya scabrispora]MYS87565.1 two-component sensor histidine kinase [Streptomyces sp. SID5474]